MNNLKTLLTASFLLASVTFATACDFLNMMRNVETSDTRNGIIAPKNRPSVNHFEKNTNAKFMAKQLLKSSAANVILGKTSDVLERYGYHTSSNGSFFSKADGIEESVSTGSFAIMSMSRHEKGDIIRVRVESNKDLQIYLNTESGVAVSFEWINLGKNEVFISPSHTLTSGNYTITLKSKIGESKLQLVVNQTELLGKK